MRAKCALVKLSLVYAGLLQSFPIGAQPATKVAAGSQHSLFVKGDGSLWVMGFNNHGQLGDGTHNNTNRPKLVVASGVATVAGGYVHSLILKSDGSLWGMGINEDGELGDGRYSSTNRPEMIVASNVTAIAAGSFHSLFLKSDGSLWATGYNQNGELGDGNYNNVNWPEMIVASNVTAIAGGDYHSLFLKGDGSLWGMGWNFRGQLGDGTFSPDSANGTTPPEQIVASNVTAIAGGAYHSLFLKNDGSLWAMGWNFYGQLGDGTTNNKNLPQPIVASNVTAIAGGAYHSLFLKSDGSLWAMGYNAYGQLGDGTPSGYYVQTNRPEQIVASGVTAIAAGGNHSLFVKSDGSLWAMGDNGYGQLGAGPFTQTNLPVQIMAGPPGYNRISNQRLSGDTVRLSFIGIAGANYVLERSITLSPPNWVSLATNPADPRGELVLVLTNTPDPGTNKFWRIRSVR